MSNTGFQQHNNEPWNNPGYGQQNTYGQATFAGPPPGFYGQPGGFPTPSRPSNGLAIAGFILALAGSGFLIPLLGWLVAPLVLLGLVFSIIGFNKARAGAPYRGLALAGIIISALTLVAGVVLNLAVYHGSVRNFDRVDVVTGCTANPAGQALVGDWAWEGQPWFRFNSDCTGENLSDGERFNWHGDGSFSNALLYRDWSLEGNTLNVTWATGATFTYTRIGN